MSFGSPPSGLLVNYSATQQRARLGESKPADLPTSESMTTKTRRSKRLRKYKKRSGLGRKKSSGKRSRVRIVKGRLALRIPGYSGVQHLGAGQLVHYIPVSKLKAAAKKFLLKTGRLQKRGRRRKGRKRKAGKRKRTV